LASVNELIRVKGMSKEVLEQLRPYVTALPQGTRLNVNTASAEVLAALVEGMTLEEAHALVALRERVWFRDSGEFERALPHGLSTPGNLAATSSQYFVVMARARRGRVSVGSRALFQRKGPELPTLLWRASL
jgi:general secretion pathway protein K